MIDGIPVVCWVVIIALAVVVLRIIYASDKHKNWFD